MKKLAKDYAGEFTCSRENTEKKKKNCFQYSKKLRRLVKMEDKLQKPHFKNSNLLIG